MTLANLTMSEAIKQISVSRGLDPRDFALFCYGGGGPLHGSDLARELHIPLVIIPPEPGNFSALGMLMADARLDNSRTYLADFDQIAASKLQGIFEEIEAASRRALAQEFGTDEISFARKIELRYKGQKHSLRIEANDLELEALRNDFDRAYRHRYGHSRPQAPIEFVAVQSTATIRMQRPDTARLSNRPNGSGIPPATRPVYFLQTQSLLEAKVYDRYTLPAGFAGSGPAVIEEYGSTTIVGPNDTFVIGSLGEIRIACTD